MSLAAIKEKGSQIEGLKARGAALLEQYKTGLPPEKQIEFDALVSRAQELKTEIEQEQKLDAAKADIADLDRFLSMPVHRHPLADDGSNDEHKGLKALGWELQSGVWCAPHSMEGKTVRMLDGSSQVLGKVPMFPDEVLHGDIPTDDYNAAHYFKQTRAAMAPEYKAAYTKYLRLMAKSLDPSLALAQMSGLEQKALTEGTDTAGGFLVPPDVQAEMLVRVAQQAVIRQYARVQQTSRDVLRYPAVAPNTTSGSIYSSGFVGGWVGEVPAFTETDPSFQLFDVNIRKLRIATKLANDFVADSSVNILAWLAMNGAENMALVEDNGFITGNGGALQPMGILNAGISTKDVEGTTSNTISNSTSNAGSAPKLVDLSYDLPAQYVSRSRYLMARATEGAIRKLVDFQGRFLWPIASGSNLAGAPRSLLDAPIDNSDFIPVGGTDANKVIIYGDISAYIIAQRAQITSVVLRERFADTDQVGIILFERVGGGVWNTDALRLGIV